MNLKKYLWKNRLIFIETPSYKNVDYLKARLIYQKNIKEFHKRFVKLITNRSKDLNFSIKLIGFDGTIKKTYQQIKPKKIFKLIDNMPMGHLVNNKKFNPTNLSLYSDYNPETTIKGLGFKNKEKAEYTIKAIKNKPIKYQVSLVSTMIGRAKNHPYRNKDMDAAIKVFQKWLDTYHKNKKN